jgi:hypothetical protein
VGQHYDEMKEDLQSDQVVELVDMESSIEPQEFGLVEDKKKTC